MRIEILLPRGGHTRKLADVEISFTDGPLAGLALTGMAIWREADTGRLTVTLPAKRVFRADGTHWCNFLRGPFAARTALVDAILAAYQAATVEARA